MLHLHKDGDNYKELLPVEERGNHQLHFLLRAELDYRLDISVLSIEVTLTH